MNVLYVGSGPSEYVDVMRHLLPDGFCLGAEESESPQFWERIVEADFLVGFKPVTEEMIQSAPRVKLIQVIGAGHNAVDLAAAAKAGILVATTGGANAVSVAEHIFALILALYRRIPYAHSTVKMGGWPQLELFRGGLFDLSGKTIGLLGLGHIGQAAARIARGFGMLVLYHRRNRLAADEERSLGVGYTPLDDLLQQADIVSVQVPLTPDTTHLIGREQLRLMKRSALLINTARGGIVDEKALVECLRERRIAGAGLDVFAEEPIPPESLLLQLDNVILTPHVGGAGQESVQRTLEESVANILRVASGEKPHNVVLASGGICVAAGEAVYNTELFLGAGQGSEIE